MLKSLARPLWRSVFRPAIDRFMRIPGAVSRCEFTASRSRFLEWSRRQKPEIVIDGGFERRFELHQFVFEHAKLDGPITYLEFGVFQGKTIRWWTEHNKNPESEFVGFDSFEGLPEEWRPNQKAGHFSVGGQTPQIDDPRCSFEVGWFNKTVIPFVHKYKFGKRLVVNLDADLYSSTILVLFALQEHLKPHDILFFDEFSDVRNEYRAFEDFLMAYPHNYRVIASLGNFGKIAIELLD